MSILYSKRVGYITIVAADTLYLILYYIYKHIMRVDHLTEIN